MVKRGNWPQNPTIYQIYPRSFNDTTGTGEGDLNGIIARLDYIADLGVDGIWLSPFYTSPMCDGGYDVADHRSVNPRFGTMDDFDRLVSGAHKAGLLVMIDQVFNHTSDTHEWYRKSIARDPEFEDFYVWADANPDGSPPSNWIGFFGYPAWKWVPERGQYCLHQFLPCQPCLNHYNDDVKQALADITAFWKDRGVDGFRYDAITSFFHDKTFTDNEAADADTQALTPGPANNLFTWQVHANDMLPQDCAFFAGKLRAWAGDEMYLIGEINDGPRSLEFAGDFAAEGRLDAGYTVDMAVRGIKADVIDDMAARIGGDGELAWWFSSHDQPRHISRNGDGSARDARMFAGLLLGLPGPLLIFQGDELGQPQANLDKGDITDPFDILYWPDPPGRDGSRTPMVWDDGPGCGFSDHTPWLPICKPPDGSAHHQDTRDDSVLNFFRRAISLRKSAGLADLGLSVKATDTDQIHLTLKKGQEPVAIVATNLATEARALPPDNEGMELILASDQPQDGVQPPRSTLWWRIIR